MKKVWVLILIPLAIVFCLQADASPCWSLAKKVRVVVKKTAAPPKFRKSKKADSPSVYELRRADRIQNTPRSPFLVALQKLFADPKKSTPKAQQDPEKMKKGLFKKTHKLLESMYLEIVSQLSSLDTSDASESYELFKMKLKVAVLRDLASQGKLPYLDLIHEPFALVPNVVWKVNPSLLDPIFIENPERDISVVFSEEVVKQMRYSKRNPLGLTQKEFRLRIQEQLEIVAKGFAGENQNHSLSPYFTADFTFGDFHLTRTRITSFGSVAVPLLLGVYDSKEKVLYFVGLHWPLKDGKHPPEVHQGYKPIIRQVGEAVRRSIQGWVQVPY